MKEQNDGQVLKINGLEIDRDGHNVSVDGRPVELTKSEYSLLLSLATHPGKAFTQRELLGLMWGGEWNVDTTPLQVHVSRLRDKLSDSVTQPRFIQTIRGYGYRFKSAFLTEDVNEDTSESSALYLEPKLTAQVVPCSVIIGVDRIIQWADSRVDQLLGFSPEELIGKSFYKLVHPDFVSKAMEVKPQLDSGTSLLLLFPFQTKSNGYRNIRAKIVPIYGPEREVSAFFAQWEPAETKYDGSFGLIENLSVENQPYGLVQLTFDKDFILRKIQPEQDFIGWAAKDILNSFFSPLGASKELLQQTVDGMMSDGQYEVATHIPFGPKSIRSGSAAALSKLLLNDEDEFDGVLVNVYLEQNLQS